MNLPRQPMTSRPPPNNLMPGTFYGLERTVAGRVEMLAHLTNAIHDLASTGFKRRVAKRYAGKEAFLDLEYRHIFLADTFFSDTLFANDLLGLFEAAAANGVPCQVLFMNPFCDQARTRSLMLAAEDAATKGETASPTQKNAARVASCWSEYELDRTKREQALDRMLPATLARCAVGMDHFCNALTALVGGHGAAANPFMEPVPESEVRDQLQNVLKRVVALERAAEARDLKIEIRFTSELLVLPLYIIGAYVYRGILMPRTSAVNKPWSIYRDDPAHNDDMFELSKEAFEQAWRSSLSIEHMQQVAAENAERKAKRERTLMIAYSSDNQWALDQVSATVEEISRDTRCPLVVERFSLQAGTGDANKDVVAKMLDTTGAGIALLLHDERIERMQRRADDAPSDQPRARSRQNVVHEMGLMQGRFGFSRVLLITEQGGAGYEWPSNITGMQTCPVRVDANGPRFDAAQLRGILQKFVTTLQAQEL